MKTLFKQIVSGEIRHKNGNLIRIDQMTIFIKKYYSNIYEEIVKSDKNGSRFIYDVINDILVTPKCYCKKDLKFRSFNHGYNKFCSNKCQLKQLHEKFDKEGYPFNREDVLQRQKIQNLKNYNVEYLFQSKEYQKSMEEKFFKKTGFKKASSLKYVKDKVKLAWSNKNINEIKNIVDTRKKTLLEKYGDENFNNLKKRRETNLFKYGEDSHMKTKKYKELFSNIMTLSKSTFYTKFLNRDGDDLKGVVYILKFDDSNLVKIGYSTSFENRSKGLIKDFGTFQIIKIHKANNCLDLERRLHKICMNYNKPLLSGVGRTEFFEKDILNLEEMKKWL
jgi:hypothetical protein